MRSILRLSSALVMLAFVICHLAAHSLLIVSADVAEQGLTILMRPWRSSAGTALLVTAFLLHYMNALWSVYRRRSLRLMPWEWAQLLLGVCIPLLLALHVSSTRIAEAALGAKPSYTYLLVLQWVVMPPLAALQIAIVSTVWTHACVGIHFWLRTKAWYSVWRPALVMFAVMLPTLALAGYVGAGNHFRREAARDASFVGRTFADANVTQQTLAETQRTQPFSSSCMSR